MTWQPRPPKQPAAASAFIVIVLAAMLFAWYLTLESKEVWPEQGHGGTEQHSSEH
jgi:hypothetical protein